MSIEKKAKFYTLRLCVNLESGKVLNDTSSSTKLRHHNAIQISDGLNERERELFTYGIDTVKLEGRLYRKIEDQVKLLEKSDIILRTLVYKLKR